MNSALRGLLLTVRLVITGNRLRLPLKPRSTILLRVEYPFPPVGIVGAADGKNAALFSARFSRSPITRDFR